MRNSLLFVKYYLNNSTKRRLEIKQETIKLRCFEANLSLLEATPIDTSKLVPFFFTNSLHCFTYPHIETETKETNHLTNSYMRVHIPLIKDELLREKMKRLNDNEIRIGRILELMDSLAGLVSYRHCFGSLNLKNAMTCVTGSVEEFQLFESITALSDICIEGYVNYTGKTSMEVEIMLHQDEKLKCFVLFTMIARDSKDLSKGYKVPQLNLNALLESQQITAKQRMILGALNVEKRKKELNESYDKMPPTEKEIKKIHEMFLLKKEFFSLQTRIPISKTTLTTHQLMHTEKRNLHGKIFGGYLMMKMLEIGWLAASHFAKEFVDIKYMTNVYFKKPVEIGVHLHIKSQITFVRDSFIIVTVQAFTSSVVDNYETIACHLHLCLQGALEPIHVSPDSYEEALEYLKSQKAFEEIFL